MYIICSKINNILHYFTGEHLTTNVNNAKRLFSLRLANDLKIEAKILCFKELNNSELFIKTISNKINKKVCTQLIEEND